MRAKHKTHITYTYVNVTFNKMYQKHKRKYVYLVSLPINWICVSNISRTKYTYDDAKSI